MILGITGTKGPAAADKTKQKAKTGSAGGPSFAQLLESASTEAAETPAALSFTPVAGYLPLAGEEEAHPDARKQAKDLLATLKQLAEDAYAGEPTATAQKLQSLADAVPEDTSQLTQPQQEAVNELKTRAAVEAAKLKG